MLLLATVLLPGQTLLVSILVWFWHDGERHGLFQIGYSLRAGAVECHPPRL